jgi:hypothetical protein
VLCVSTGTTGIQESRQGALKEGDEGMLDRRWRAVLGIEGQTAKVGTKWDGRAALCSHRDLARRTPPLVGVGGGIMGMTSVDVQGAGLIIHRGYHGGS